MTAALLAPSRARAPERQPSWDGARIVRFCALGALFAITAWVHLANMNAYPASVDDEGTYVAQAWALLSRGDLAHYSYWYDHPPGGWVLIAIWGWLTDGFARASSGVALGREVAFLAKMASSALLYVLCRRIGMRWGWGALAVAVFALSPLSVEYHRMIFLDNLVTPWVLAAFVLLHGKRSLGAYAGAGVCFAVAALIKITAGIFLPVILWALWRTCAPQHRRYALTVLLGSFGLVVMLWPLMALLRGELIPGADNTSLIDGLIFQLSGREGNSILDVGEYWLFVDRLILVVGAAAAVPALLLRRLRGFALVLVLHGLVVARGGYIPQPFVIQILPYLALVIAGVGDALWRQLEHGRQGRSPRHLLRAGLATTLLGALAWSALLPMAQQWPDRLQYTQAHDGNRGYREVVPWIMGNIDPDANILVENQIWLDTILAGRPESSTIWHFKLGLDPEVTARFPNGHGDFEYIVASQHVVDSQRDSPMVTAALQESYPVRRFAEGVDFVEVRRIVNTYDVDTLEGLQRHYGHPRPGNLFGYYEADVVGETAIADLPKPPVASLVEWHHSIWLVDPVEEVRFPIYPTDITPAEERGTEQYYASLGATSWDDVAALQSGQAPPSEPDPAPAAADADPRAALLDRLGPGDSGAEVRRWQSYLQDWDAAALPRFGADGVFGQETEDWTGLYRAQHGAP